MWPSRIIYYMVDYVYYTYRRDGKGRREKKKKNAYYEYCVAASHHAFLVLRCSFKSRAIICHLLPNPAPKAEHSDSRFRWWRVRRCFSADQSKSRVLSQRQPPHRSGRTTSYHDSAPGSRLELRTPQTHPPAVGP